METKKLLEYEFQFVQELQPVRNRDGSIREVAPQERYAKSESSQLNKYGSGTFCYFLIDAAKWTGASGVYAIYIENQLVYIGQTQNLAKRFNQEYGSISPRACYEHGQTTNCKINKLILNAAISGKHICLYFLLTQDYSKVEAQLIGQYNPHYNVALRTDGVIPPSQQQQTKTVPTNPLKSSEKSVSNASVSEVRAYIQKLIQTSKSNGQHELIVSSSAIHKELGMSHAYKTVCEAMRTLPGEYYYDVLKQPAKGNGAVVFNYIF